MKRVLLIVMIVMVSIAFSGCGAKPLSKQIVGDWAGQADIAKVIYKELGDKLGIELSPEPAYCDVSVTFREDGSGEMIIDQESFAQAVGQCVEPYTSAFFDFDTESLVSLLMQYVSKDMDESGGHTEFSYTVDDKSGTVLLSESSDEMEMVLNEDGQLEYQEEELGQTITFEKQ